MKRAVIFGSAPVLDWSFAQHYLRPEDLVIAADGGRAVAERLGLRPDWYVGDSDSGGCADGIPSDLLPSEKDVTDLDMAVSRGFAEGATEFVLLGCTGGREDHHLSAIGQLERIHQMGGKGVIADPCNEIHLLTPGTTEVPGAFRFHYFGVVPLDAKLERVTIAGAKYEISNVDLYRAASLGISNEAAGDGPCTVSIQNGVGLLILSERISF